MDKHLYVGNRGKKKYPVSKPKTGRGPKKAYIRKSYRQGGIQIY